MKVNFTFVLVVCIGMLGFQSCVQKKNQTATNGMENSIDSAAKPPTGQPVDLTPDEAINDAARFVAGLPVQNTRNKLYGLTQTAEWKTHAKNMDQIWNSFQQSAPKILSFTQKELSAINQKSSTLFYPFGGPDFLFANAFFPGVDTYFLIGLERTGQQIQVKHPSPKTYRLYQDAVSDVLSLSFFRTRDMNVEAENDTIDGVIPIISMLMARTEKEIISIENKRINDKGEIVSTNEDGSPVNDQTGLVEMKFLRKGTKRLQTLYYYATDLSNEGLEHNKGLYNYISDLDPQTTVSFIKSASYLMHEPAFSEVRNLTLDHSMAILQDDSAIPLPHYDEEKWKITLYGTFYKPIPAYAKYAQPELRNAYQLGDPKPLNFRIGFSRQSNLQLAVRK